MASSSVSQEDLENDFELTSRRSRIRTARARTVNPQRLGECDEFIKFFFVLIKVNLNNNFRC